MTTAITAAGARADQARAAGPDLAQAEAAALDALAAWAGALDQAAPAEREASGTRVRSLVRHAPHLRDQLDYLTPHRHADNDPERAAALAAAPKGVQDVVRRWAEAAGAGS